MLILAVLLSRQAVLSSTPGNSRFETRLRFRVLPAALLHKCCFELTLDGFRRTKVKTVWFARARIDKKGIRSSSQIQDGNARGRRQKEETIDRQGKKEEGRTSDLFSVDLISVFRDFGGQC